VHTQFNYKYTDDIGMKNPFINVTSEDEDGNQKEEGFGADKYLAEICYQKKLEVFFDDSVTIKGSNEPIIIAVSDLLYNKSEYSIRIENKLKSLLNDNTILYCYFHKSAGSGFKDFVEREFKNNIRDSIVQSHWDSKNSPFYSLVEIVNSTTKNEFNQGLIKLRGWLPTEGKIEKNKDKRILLGLLKDLKEYNYEVELNKIETANKYLIKEKKDYYTLFKTNLPSLINKLKIIISNL
jgi:hypothetical protein